MPGDAMTNEPARQVARLDRGDLADLPTAWTDAERGRHLSGLLRTRGIDLARLYRAEYYVGHQCWLLTQEPEPAAGPAAADDALLFRDLIRELRRAAQGTWKALAGRSLHFAAHGRRYQLPPEAEPLTPAALAELLGGPVEGPRVHFTSEGGWLAASPDD